MKLKHINVIFVMILAFLVFESHWTQFNEYYLETNVILDYENIIDNNHEVYQVTLSTHFLGDERYDMIQDVVDLLEQQDLVSSIGFEEQSVGNVREVLYFVLVDISDAFSHLSFYQPIDPLDFKSENETGYISNDLAEKDAIHLRYLDKSYHDVYGSFPRHKFVYRPMHQIFDLEGFEYNRQVTVSFVLPPDDVDNFKSLFFESIIIKYGYCDVEPIECKDGMFWDSTEFIHSIHASSSYSIFDAPFVMPNPLIFISSITLFISSIVEMIRNRKESMIRRLHGNSDFVMLRYIVIPFLSRTIVAFYGTLMLLIITRTGITDALSLKFIATLKEPALWFGVLLVMVVMILYFMITVKDRVTSLKVSFGSQTPFILVSGLKALVIVLVSAPFIQTLQLTTDLHSNLKEIHDDPIYLDTMLIETPNQSIAPLFSPHAAQLGVHDQRAKDALFVLLNDYDFIYTDIYSYEMQLSLNSNLVPYAIINDHLLTYYDFTNHDVPVSFSDRESNFIIVPETHKNHVLENAYYQKILGDVEFVFVDKTPTVFDNFAGYTSGYESPLLYVMVDDYSWLSDSENGIRKVVRNEAEKQEFEKGHQYVLENAAMTSAHSAIEMYEVNQDRLVRYTIETLNLLIVLLIITTLFSYLKVLLFFVSRKKELIIKTIHGFGFIERYGLLFIEILLSLLLIYVGYRYFNQLQLWDYLKLTLMNCMGVMGIILMIESTLTIYLIKRFQSHNVSTYLKGSE